MRLCEIGRLKTPLSEPEKKDFVLVYLFSKTRQREEEKKDFPFVAQPLNAFIGRDRTESEPRPGNSEP